MNVNPVELRPTELDRRDPVECLLDNLRRAHTLSDQKAIIRAHEKGLLKVERQRVLSRVEEMADNLVKVAKEAAY